MDEAWKHTTTLPSAGSAGIQSAAPGCGELGLSAALGRAGVGARLHGFRSNFKD